MVQQRKKCILVTRPLKGQQISYARRLGLDPLIKPALRFEFPEYWDKVLREITEHRKAGWVFTSRNAVKALKELLERGLQVLNNRKIYAVGRKTRDALRELGLDAEIPRTQDSGHLANYILEQGEVDSVIYFRGSRSRKTLAKILQEGGVEVDEVEVYRTELNEIDLPEKVIDAVLFYSPSAVEAYAKSGGFDDKERNPIIFAIGPTTAESLKPYTNGSVEVADEPSTEILLRNVADQLNSL